jgi:threonine dehydratase
MASIIAKAQGDVIRLDHNQFVSINRNSAVELTITMETFGHEHKQQIVQELINNGYNPKMCTPSKVY